MSAPPTVPMYLRLRSIMQTTLTADQKLLLCALLEHLGAGEVCWPSIKRLQVLTSRSERHVQKQIAALEDLKILSVERRPGWASRYRIDWAALEAQQIDPRTACTPAQRAPHPRKLDGGPPHSVHPTPAQCADEQNQRTEPENKIREQDQIPPKPPRGPTAPELFPELSLPEQPPDTDTDTTRKPTPAEVWTDLEAIRCDGLKARGQPYRKRTLKPIRRQLVARLKEHSPDDLKAVWSWWQTSNDPRARYLRDHNYGPSTLLRPGNFADYLDCALAPVAQPDTGDNVIRMPPRGGDPIAETNAHLAKLYGRLGLSLDDDVSEEEEEAAIARYEAIHGEGALWRA
ncbi:MAG: helix-turn-helix domain-containing protein [Myxococcota bacterium]